MKPINPPKPISPISPAHPRRVLVRLAVLATCLSTCIFALNGTAWGQSSSQNSRAPINLPPLSYTGAQFIDNNHCVFLRAGYGGNIVWVPRVSRNREPLCDDRLTPTFAPKPKPAQTAQTTTTAPISKRELRQRAREEQRIIAALSAKEVATARADLREQRAAQKRAEAQSRADGKIQAKAEKRNRKEALRVLREVQKADAQKQNTQTKTQTTQTTQPQKPAPPTGLISLGFYVSVTGFDSEGQAHNLRDWFKQSGYSTKIGLDGNILTVIIGPFPSALDAKAPFHQARAKGYTQTIIAERYKRNRHSG